MYVLLLLCEIVTLYLLYINRQILSLIVHYIHAFCKHTYYIYIHNNNNNNNNNTVLMDSLAKWFP
jgi:hypothetical protein